MAEHGFPVLVTLLAWWLSTGLILYLDGLPKRTFPWSMAGATLVLGVALLGLWQSASDTSDQGAYVAFLSALAVWGWHETAFLLGYVTGPRRRGCPHACGGWRHFLHASEAVIWHELAIFATLPLVLLLTWEGPNQVGVWTFFLLWLMRLSAKLNLHLGVPNLGEALLPPHLRYLASFFRRRPMNPLFPISVTATTIGCLLAVQAAGAADGHAATGLTCLATLLALGTLEHWFLVLPLPAEAPWRWALRRREPGPLFIRPLPTSAPDPV